MKDKNDHILLLLQKPEFKEWVLRPTDESNYYWENWLEHHPDSKEDVNKAKELIMRLRFHEGTLEEQEKDEMFKNIISRKEQISPQKYSIPRFRVFRYAAMLVLAIGAGMVFWNLIDNGPKTDKAQPAVTYIHKANPKGQKSTIRLKDGTEVRLNSNSSLEYASDFGTSNRKVILKGEAYFSVAKDPKKPFIVTTGNVLTTALGTEFNINARNENKPRIILTEGKIKVEDKMENGTPFILLPNQFIEYNSKTGFSKVSEVDNLNEILWINGILKFEHTPLLQVVEELENWYGVDVEIVGNPEGLHYSGEFKDEYLSSILTAMSFSLGLEYSQENEFVQLNLKR